MTIMIAVSGWKPRKIAGQHHQEHDVDGQRHAVDRVAGDPAEDAPRLVDRAVDHRQPGRGQDQRRGAAGGVGGAGHGGAAVGLLQGRRVVDAVAGHRDQVAARLQRLDDGVLVLGEDAGEAVGLLDRVGDRGRHVVGVHVLGEGVGGREMLVPMPSWRAISIAMAVSSPVTILTAMPLAFAASIVALESSRGGSNIGRMPSSDQVCARRPRSGRPPSARLPFAASSATVVLDPLGDVGRAAWPGRRSPAARPWRPSSVLPLASLTFASVRLVTGSNGTNFRASPLRERLHS